MAIKMPDMPMGTAEWVERKSCKNKRDFLTKASAKKLCKSVKKKQGIRMYAYECDFCGKWHTSRSKPRKDND